MGFRSFRVKIILRIVILGFAIAGFVFFVQKKDYYFTSIELLAVAVLLSVELIHFIEKGYRQLNGMLESVKEKDFNISFNAVEMGGVFARLAKLLNELTESYRATRIEKEVHYQFLNHVVDHVNQVLICFDINGNVNLSNLATRNLLKSKQVKHISAFGSIDEQLPKLFTNLTEGQEQVVSFDRNGELVQYAITCSSIRLLDKYSKLVVMHDISQPLREQEIESYRKLIRVLTHEIMNSVTPILSLSEAMNEMLKHPDNSPRPIDVLTPQESADLAEGYLAIESRSRALMRFVNDFRSLTKLPEPNISTIDPEKLLKPIIALLKPILDSKDIKVTLTVGKDIKNVLADKDLIEQVIINLIKNAIDATDNTDHPEINIEISSRVGKKIISISDNGKGISKENLDKVFVPFFSTKEQGSGIGLSLSQQIMRLHNGTITLKSIEGHGSEFSLIFPK